jgi:hypothetical protein
MSISLTMNNTFHISLIHCPFFWDGCYMYLKQVCASYSHEKKGFEIPRLMNLIKKIEREKSLIQNVGQINKQEKKSIKNQEENKHELYPLTKRTSPQVLCNDCISYERI